MDALRDYERLVAAAGEALGERGVDAPLDEIARRAGIGDAPWDGTLRRAVS